MTDNEIIKALEKARDVVEKDDDSKYAVEFCEDAIALFNRQKAEIERLQKQLDIARDCICDIEYAADKAGSNDRIDNAIDNYNNLVKEMTEGKENA